jgi:hypothetical protein
MAARDAEPGDTLWSLSKVLYADHARSVEAARSVRTDLKDAQAALNQGKINEAKDALAAAGTALSSVSTEDGKDDLRAKHESLLEQLTSTPGVPTPSQGDRPESAKPPVIPSSSSQPPPPSATPSDPPSHPPSSTPTPSDPPTVPRNTGIVDPPPAGPPRSVRSDSPRAGSGSNAVTPNSAGEPANSNPAH